MSWHVRLAAQVDSDIEETIEWTRHFGAKQARAYLQTITLAIEALVKGPDIPGARTRDDIRIGVRTLHIAWLGRRGRHFLIFIANPEKTIVVLRMLHESMDLPRHIEATELLDRQTD